MVLRLHKRPFFLRLLSALLLSSPFLACEPGDLEDDLPPAGEWLEPVSDGSTAEEEWETLIAFDEWLAIPSFPPLDALGTVDCAEGAAQVEESALEVNSTYCSFALFDASIPFEVTADTSLRWRHWHLNLWAPEPAVGTIELYVGEESWYKVEYAIPGPADFEEVIFHVGDPIPEGTRITIHFRNHGLNSWRFGSLELLDSKL